MRRFFLPVLRVGAARATGPRKPTKLLSLILIRAGCPAAGIIVFLLSAAMPLFGQTGLSLYGTVTDSATGAPVPDAAVRLVNTSFSANSDQAGRYELHHIPPGVYRMGVTASGFADAPPATVRLLPDLAQRVDVAIRRRLYRMPDRIVHGERIAFATEPMTVVEPADIVRLRPRDVSELLQRVPGVHIQQTGTAGSPAMVRMRGGTPDQVLVMVDGHKLNPSGGGTADVNSIPIDAIERIEVYKGGASAEFGPDALTGAINIVTKPSGSHQPGWFEAERAWGGLKTERYRLVLANLIDDPRLDTRLAVDLRQAWGDFAYSYSAQPTLRTYDGVRLNNASDRQSYHLSGKYDLSSQWDVDVSAQLFESRNGLPDRADRQNTNAIRDDERILVSAQAQRESESAVDRAGVSISQLRQEYIDTVSTPVTFMFHTRYVNDIMVADYTRDQLLPLGIDARFGIEARRDRLYQDDYLRPSQAPGTATRDNLGINAAVSRTFSLASISPLRSFTVDAALRRDYARTSKDATQQYSSTTVESNHWSPRVGVAVSAGEATSVTLRGSYGTSFRLPALNALFWKPDARAAGNPELRPEVSEHSDIGLEVHTTMGAIRLRGEAAYFHSHLRDLVVWAPDFQGVWKPKNLGRALVTGHEESLEVDILDHSLTFSYVNTITSGRNRAPGHNSFNKELVFSPHYITTLSARFEWWWLRGAYSVRLVDRTYTNEANTKYYDAYRVDDLSAGISLPVAGDWKLAADYRIDNVGDTDYVLITHYPMPGRNWQLGVSINYGRNGRAHAGR